MGRVDLHVMCISANCERETAVDLRICRLEVRILQRAASQHGLLSVVEGDGTEFLPVADQVIFDDNLVNGQFSLRAIESVMRPKVP